MNKIKQKKSPTKKDIKALNNFYKNKILKNLKLTQEVQQKIVEVDKTKAGKTKLKENINQLYKNIVPSPKKSSPSKSAKKRKKRRKHKHKKVKPPKSKDSISEEIKIEEVFIEKIPLLNFNEPLDSNSEDEFQMFDRLSSEKTEDLIVKNSYNNHKALNTKLKGIIDELKDLRI